MAEEPDYEELGTESDPQGSMETRKLQQLGRVDIPDEYLEHIGVSEGSKVLVVCEEDSVRITKATKEKVFQNGQ